MAGREISDFEELLRELGRARSLRARLRVLGHAWGLLRKLPPARREEVALRLGSDWAWKRVERAFLSDGEISESEQLVGRAFERLRGSDPAELRALAASLKQGGPEGARDLLLMTLTEALEEEAEQEEAAAAREEPAAPPDTAHEEPEPPPDAEPEPRAALPEVVSDIGAVLASTLASKIRRAGEAEVEPPQQPAPSEPWPSPSEPRPAPAPPAPLAPPQLGPAATPPSGSALEVLRRLTHSAQPGAELGPAGRARLIESLGGGWASRRALSRLISARALDDLDEALALVARLPGPSNRVWCLADLLAHWPLDARELERVLAAAPSEPARRRLERRWRRSRERAAAAG